jgi:hypothetical protein
MLKTSPLCGFIALLIGSPLAEAEVSFNRDIRPLLSENCFACHGPDKDNIKADLRLDLREWALRPAKSGDRAIVPGKPEESELLNRIVSGDADEVMPPPKEHKKMSKEQVALLRQWIAEGAPYEGHWAFQTPQRPAVPQGESAHPVDAFIRARLRKEGLTHSPEASRETLIRRVTLDLTGLPPTPKEVAAFLGDSRPGAYERVVDRLLAAPAYGEHMAQQWLDFARYADSNGFQADYSRQQWPWRDWVIDSFNRNQPFDEFTVEQMAGDLLPDPTRSQVVATGFHRNHRLNGEGGLIPEEWFVETVIDRVETTGLTWLGLTMNCCRCHDHKYDPISQKDFFKFFAFFNSVDETGTLRTENGRAGAGNTDPVLPLLRPEEEKQAQLFRNNVQEAERALARAKSETPAAAAAWEAGLAERGTALLDGRWTDADVREITSSAGAVLRRMADGSFLVSGKTAQQDSLTLTLSLADGRLSALKLETLNDPSLPGNGPARGGDQGPVISALEVEVLPGKDVKARKVAWARADADSQMKGFTVESAAGLAPGKGWAVAKGKTGQPSRAVFVAERPVAEAGPVELRVRIVQKAGGAATLGRFRLSVSGDAPERVHLRPETVLKPIRAALALPADRRTPQQRKQIEDFFVRYAENAEARATAALTSARAAEKKFMASVPTVMVLREREEPRPAFVLKRGEYDKPGEPVGRGVPASLPPLPEGAPLNRLGLARWMVSEQQPLTARVWVNRAWERLFGVGIVKTSENFGAQAEWPVHLDLLNWLAVEFMRPSVLPAVNGVPAARWDRKALLKFLVLSETYRQSTRVTPALLERDPDNRLLARGPRFRLSGEAVRDQALALSGLLVSQVGGPSVRPYMPEGVWDETSRYGDLRGYKPDQGAGLYRRSLYTLWKRTAAPPSMLLFDAPTREICAVKRSRSNTPLQALSLLNEVTYVEAARGLAHRMFREGGQTHSARLAWGFRTVTGREGRPEELAILEKGLLTRLERYRQQPQTAADLIAQGASKPDPSIPVPDLAAYTLSANVLLNLDEVITRE